MIISSAFAPLIIYAAGSITVTTDKSMYFNTSTIHVSGNVTPPPPSGNFVGLSVKSPAGSVIDSASASVSATTGAYSASFVTGGSLYSVNGTYTIVAVAPDGASSSTTFQYGCLGCIVELNIKITVHDITTKTRLTNGQNVSAGDKIKVTIHTNGIDCTGSYIVTSLSPNPPPPLIVQQFDTFTIGPNSPARLNHFTGPAITLSGLTTGQDDWKISASCNGLGVGQFAFSQFEFFVTQV